jgi:hypothetical protein
MKNNCAFTLLSRGDKSHIQPFFLHLNTDGVIQLQISIASQVILVDLPPKDYSNYWTKFTVTYDSDGIVSNLKLYINNTQYASADGFGGYLRFQDQAVLILGAHSADSESPLSIFGQNRFIGSIDNFAIYNRVIPHIEIVSNWQKDVNSSDPSLVLFYNFDEGPNAIIIKNKAASNIPHSDMVNGRVFGSLFFDDALSPMDSKMKETSPAYLVRPFYF